LLEVSSIIVDLSRTCRAAAIWALRRSSFRSFCLSPVRWASSTISAPNWLNAFTNSVKLFTDSNRSRLWETCRKRNRLFSGGGKRLDHLVLRQEQLLHHYDVRQEEHPRDGPEEAAGGADQGTPVGQDLLVGLLADVLDGAACTRVSIRKANNYDTSRA
jgi:hypothetical protein